MKSSARTRRRRRLTSLREKLGLLDSCGVDTTYVCRFSRAFASIEAVAFIERVLVAGIGVRHLIIGDDFCFGKGRSGNIGLLQQEGQRCGFTVEALPTVEVVGERVSSSAVRDALARGIWIMPLACSAGPIRFPAVWSTATRSAVHWASRQRMSSSSASDCPVRRLRGHRLGHRQAPPARRSQYWRAPDHCRRSQAGAGSVTCSTLIAKSTAAT